jgi:hypothetical protein
MMLLGYVAGVQDSKKNIYPSDFPSTLELPLDFAEKLRKMALKGENNGCELGRQVTFQARESSIELQELVKGGPTSCQIPRTADGSEFADLHTHPHMSIGHVEGYCAHSLEDYFVFDHHRHKPLFIRFVSTGDWIYAVAFRNGLTIYDSNLIKGELGTYSRKGDQFFERFSPVGAEKGRMLGEIDATPIFDLAERFKEYGIKIPTERKDMAPAKQALMDRQVVEWKKQTPMYGATMMALSIAWNKKMATESHYGFYGAMNSNVLALEAGPKGV